MPSTTITGLASGVEWGDTVDMLMQIKRQPLVLLENRQAENQSKKDAWTSIQGKLESLQAASKLIDQRNELQKKASTSSDSDILYVSASASAISATHTVIVNQLAQAEVEVHSGWADVNTTPVISGTDGQFDFQYAGVDYSVPVPDGTTINELVRIINSYNSHNIESDDLDGIVASVIDDGGDTDPIHLVISAKESGEDNTVTILDTTDLGTTGTEFDSASFTETQSARNSQIRVDGFPAGSWITRESNTIDDVVEGLTFVLKDTSASGIEINIDDDTSSIKDSIQNWVDAYNEVMLEITAKTRYDSETEEKGILMGDGQVFRLRAELQTIVGGEIPGIAETAKYQNLTAIGIDSGSDNQLSIDDEELTDALEDNLGAVVELFVFESSSDNSVLQYFSRTSNTEGGIYEVVAEYDAEGKLDPDGTNTIGGYPATVENDKYLVGAAGTPVEGLRIYFEDPEDGPGTATAEIRIGTGAAVLTDNKVEELTDSIDGLIKIVKEGYDNAISQIQTQIESMERRLEIVEDQYNRQFTNMELAISEAQNQSAYLGSI